MKETYTHILTVNTQYNYGIGIKMGSLKVLRLILRNRNQSVNPGWLFGAELSASFPNHLQWVISSAFCIALKHKCYTKPLKEQHFYVSYSLLRSFLFFVHRLLVVCSRTWTNLPTSNLTTELRSGIISASPLSNISC